MSVSFEEGVKKTVIKLIAIEQIQAELFRRNNS